VLRSAYRARTQNMTVSPPRAQVVLPLRAHFQVDNDCLAAARPGCLAAARPFSSRQLRSHGTYETLRHDDVGMHGGWRATALVT